MFRIEGVSFFLIYSKSIWSVLQEPKSQSLNDLLFSRTFSILISLCAIGGFIECMTLTALLISKSVDMSIYYQTPKAYSHTSLRTKRICFSCSFVCSYFCIRSKTLPPSQNSMSKYAIHPSSVLMISEPWYPRIFGWGGRDFWKNNLKI